MRKPDPVREVTQTIPVENLDARAQERARHLRKVYGWTLYAFQDGPPATARWIVSANCPFHDDTRDWSVVDLGETK